MIKNLQILRAMAALLVVFFHCDFEHIKVGQFGVDIFFVISGFIISFVLSKRQQHFLIKRFIRVVPMYLLFTFFLVGAWAIYPKGFNNVYISASTIVRSVFFIPYSINGSGPILSLGWTLNCEVFFYVITGVSALLLVKPSRALLLTSIIIIGVFLVASLSGTNSYYLLFYGNQVTLEFIFGIILFFITTRWREQFRKKIILLVMGVLAATSLAMMCYFDYNKFYSDRLLYFGIPAFFIVLFCIISEHLVNAENPVYKYLYRIGNASYVVYLLHPFIVLGIIRVVNPRLPSNILFSFVELSLMLGLVMIISDLIHRKIELPVVRTLERLLHNRVR